MLLVVFLLDVLTPNQLVFGILFAAPIALSGLAGRPSFTRAVIVLAVLANVLAVLANVLRGGFSAYDVANRVLSVLAALLVGFLTLRFREASSRAALLDAEEFRAQHERALRELTLGTVAQMEPLARERGVTLEPQLEGSVKVLEQRGELRRAIQNVLENAVKFSPPSGTVRLSLQTEDGEAELQVSDEGPGLSPSAERGLYQRFRGRWPTLWAVGAAAPVQLAEVAWAARDLACT